MCDSGCVDVLSIKPIRWRDRVAAFWSHEQSLLLIFSRGGRNAECCEEISWRCFMPLWSLWWPRGAWGCRSCTGCTGCTDQKPWAIARYALQYTYSPIQNLFQSYAEDQKSCWNEFFSYSKHLQTAQMPSSFRTLTHEIFGLENQWAVLAWSMLNVHWISKHSTMQRQPWDSFIDGYCWQVTDEHQKMEALLFWVHH